MVARCRDCPLPTRERCIGQSPISPSVKMMMRGAFEAGTDTEWMWGLLQMNCLLLSRDRDVEPSRPPPVTRRPRGEARRARAAEQATRVSVPSSPAPVSVEVAPSGLYLVLQRGRHRIALPRDGEIVLGRFDPMVKSTPDVDLSYENARGGAVSRRHARIIGRDGAHVIEDVGSTGGTMVNWRRLRIGQRVQLHAGDRIILGRCEFVYGAVPETQISPHVVPQASLLVTYTGHRFPLPVRGELVIGRSDRSVGLNPDIDLSQQGNAAQFVARRHAKIVVRDNRHYVEDLGSASGTKLNGVRLRIGTLGLLYPACHFWLGGCVLAYDIESRLGRRSGR